ncbi:hypothetical protein RD792_015935 [Penstemon davidsonii]|uniref:Flap endonuclease 1 n=1 Tax=Penstemon davidsonii TaxID=160366 RepID=A0ABR0CI64_9LAMI|nr:hypothetical protein RD792_015935 [Penstemon davidsonii]
MGIKGLTKLLADNAPKAMKEQKFESYFGRKIAIDASMSIYQFLIVIGRSGTEMLTNEAGEVTSYVFDGKPPDLKKQELAKRYSKRADATEDLNDALKTGNKEDIEKFSKRTVKVTKQHNDDCKKLLRLMGVPVVEAPSEAEAQCAALCKADKVYAVASEDMDSLTFGASRFLRHLMDPSSKKIPVMEFDVSKVLEELNLTMDQFIDLCILSGCDYCDSIRGIGGLTALKLIRQHGSIENILENINKERYQIPENWPYQEARRLFKEPSVSTDDEIELKWTAPDEEGLIRLLAIEKIKVAKNKSSQGRLESFFKPVAGASVPAKRKGTRCTLAIPKPVVNPKMYSLEASFHSRPKAIGSIGLPSVDLGSRQAMDATEKEAVNKKTKAGGRAFGQVYGNSGSSSAAHPFSSTTYFNPPLTFGSTTGNQSQGSRVASYSATSEFDKGSNSYINIQSISAMPMYKHKSHEELRFDDHEVDCKGRQTAFGFPKPFNSTHTNTFQFPPVSIKPLNSTQTNTFQFPPVSIKPLNSTQTNTFQFPPVSIKPLNSTQTNTFQFPPVSNPPSTSNLLTPKSQTFGNPNNTFPVAPTFAPSGSLFAPSTNTVFSSMPAPTSNHSPFSLSGSTQLKPSNNFQFPQISTTSTSSTVSPSTWPSSITPLGPQTPFWQDSTSNPSFFQGEGSKHKACASSCFHVNVNSIELEEEDPEVSALMPKLQNIEYYTEPSIEELEAMEKTEPGFCSRVKNFVIGRKDRGSIKFLGEIDIRKLDLESIVQFNDREVIVYADNTKMPPSGQGLNSPAEVTLLNVKCISKKTGKQCTDGPMVQRYKTMLISKATELGVEFVSYDPVLGEWKFRVKHF